ncbi:MAG: GFA family protein [Rhizobiales bacterium]|nr:GFA family protein [Hyphomicrobiales bacterium]
MKHEGGCHCGAVRYAVGGEAVHAALCHCSDCRKSSGAPMVGWVAFRDGSFSVTKGEAKTRNSSGASMRSFCPECGTGLWFRNAEHLPGIVDVQLATLDNPDAIAPQAHIQTAERIDWMKEAHRLPEFERFPE